MYIRKLSSDPKEIWSKITLYLKHFHLSWKDIALRLGYYNDKEVRSFLARKRRKTSDWKTIVEVLEVLHCPVFMTVSDSFKDVAIEKKFSEAKEIVEEWLSLTEKDKQLVLALAKRLNDVKKAF